MRHPARPNDVEKLYSALRAGWEEPIAVHLNRDGSSVSGVRRMAPDLRSSYVELSK